MEKEESDTYSPQADVNVPSGTSSPEYKPKLIESDESMDDESGVGGSGSTCSLGLLKEDKMAKDREDEDEAMSYQILDSVDPTKFVMGPSSTPELSQHMLDTSSSTATSQQKADNEHSSNLQQYPLSDTSNSGSPRPSRIPVKPGSSVKPRIRTVSDSEKTGSVNTPEDILDKVASDISSQVLIDAVSEVEQEEAVQNVIGQVSSEFVAGQLSVSQNRQSDDEGSTDAQSEQSEPTTTSGISGDKNNMYHICEPWSDQDGAGTWSTDSSAKPTPRDGVIQGDKDPVRQAAEQIATTVAATPKLLPQKYYTPSVQSQVLETPQGPLMDSIYFNQSQVEATPGQHVPVSHSTPFIPPGVQDLQDLRKRFEGFNDSIQAGDMSTFTGAQIVPDVSNVQAESRDVETDEETIKGEEEVESVIAKAGVRDYMPAEERERLMQDLGARLPKPMSRELGATARYYTYEEQQDVAEIRSRPRPQPLGTDADSDSTDYRVAPSGSSLLQTLDPVRRTAMTLSHSRPMGKKTEEARVRILNDPDTIPQRESDLSDTGMRRTPDLVDISYISDGERRELPTDLHRGECSDTSYQELPGTVYSQGSMNSGIDDASARSVIKDVNTSLGDTIITEIEDFLAQQRASKKYADQHNDVDDMYRHEYHDEHDGITDDSIAARVRELLRKCEQERSFAEESSNSTMVPSMVSDISVESSPKKDNGPYGDALDTEVTPDISSSGMTSDTYHRILGIGLDEGNVSTRSEDSLSEKVHRLLQNTAYLGSDMSPRASPRSIHDLIHSINVHDDSLDYEKIQRELEGIERSLEEKGVSPQSSQASSQRSTSDECDKSKRLAWDYGADIGEGGLPQFVASVKNPQDDLLQALNNLTAIEEDRRHRRARSVSPDREEFDRASSMSLLRGRSMTESSLAMEQQVPSLSGLIADQDSLAHKVWRLLEKESPQRQAYEILKEAEENEQLIQLRALQTSKQDDDHVRYYEDRDHSRDSFESHRSLPGSRSMSHSRLHTDLYRPHSFTTLSRADSLHSADLYHREVQEKYSKPSEEKSPSDLRRPHSSTSLHQSGSAVEERASSSLSRHASSPTLSSLSKLESRSQYDSLGMSLSPMADKPYRAFSHATDLLSIQLDKMHHQRFDLSPKRYSKESLRESRHSPVTSPKKSPSRPTQRSPARGPVRRELASNDTHDTSREVAELMAAIRQRDIKRRLTPKDGRYLLPEARTDGARSTKSFSNEDQTDRDTEMRELASGRLFSTTKEVESSDVDSTPRNFSSVSRQVSKHRQGLDSHREESITLSMGETTMESTHTGSDDAEGPFLPQHLLGSRPDIPSLSGGIYANTGRAKSLERVNEARDGLIEIRAPSEYCEENPQYRRPAWQEEVIQSEQDQREADAMTQSEQMTRSADGKDVTEMGHLQSSTGSREWKDTDVMRQTQKLVNTIERVEEKMVDLRVRSPLGRSRGAESANERPEFVSSKKSDVEKDITVEDLTGLEGVEEFQPLEPTMSANSSDKEDPPLKTANLKPRPALKILQDILEGESDSSDSIPQDLNDMWKRYKAAKDERNASALTRQTREKIGVLGKLLKNPTHHLVHRMEEESDLCKYKRKLKERFGDDYEKVLSQRREAWRQKEGRRSREGLSGSLEKTKSPVDRAPKEARDKPVLTKQVYVESVQNDESEQAQLEADLSQTLRRQEASVDDGTPRSGTTDAEMRAKMATILNQTDSLTSIPEDNVLNNVSTDISGSIELDRIPRAKLDPKFVKLHQKIREQKEKYAKEKRRELKRKEKIVKLERILHDKKSGKDSSITDSSSMTTVSSLHTTSTISDVVVSDTSIEDTSALKSLKSTASPTVRASQSESAGTYFRWEKKARDARLSTSSDSSFCPCKENIYQDTQTTNAEQGSREGTRRKKGVYLEIEKPQRQEMYKVRPRRSRSLEKGNRQDGKREQPQKRTKKVQVKSPKMQRQSKMKNAGQSFPTPKFSPRTQRRLISAGTQTSPRLLDDYQGLTDRSTPRQEAGDDVPEELKAPYSRIFSPEKIFTEKKKYKPSPKGSPGGMAWYVPIRSGSQPGRMPLKERQTHFTRHQSEPWSGPAPLENERNNLEGIQVDVDTEFCLTKGVEEKDAGKKKMTLQESLQMFREDFISHSRERERRIQLAALERQLRLAHDEQREKLFKHRKKKVPNVNAHPLSDLWFRPQKRVMSKKEMKEITDRIYKRLPEVTEKAEVKKREEECRTNRVRAEIYKRKQLEKVLGRY